MKARRALHALLLLAAGLLPPLAAHAHSQVRDPANCSSIEIGNPDWGTPANAQTSNNARTTSTVNDDQTTDVLRCLNYGFTIPVGATILGVIVNVERRVNTTAGVSPVLDERVQLLKAGVVQPADRADGVTTYTTGDVTIAHGSATDLWGTTWTPADINNANFGVDFAAFKNGAAGGGVQVQVDHVEIEVFYSQAPPQVTLASPADGATVATPQPTFSWNAAVDADGDTVTYDLQADDSGCTFPSPEVDQTGLAGTSFVPSPLFAGTYCWRVRAVDAHGIAGAWSTTRNVTVDAPATLSQTASPGSCVNVAVGGNPNWGTPANAQTDNGVYTTSAVNDNEATDALVCTQYGFAIPTGATILGIVVSVERRASSLVAPTRDFSMLVLKGGVAQPGERASGADYTLADFVEAHGSAADLWGTTWTPADINATDFGARFMAQKVGTAGANITISVDHVAITVHYTNPAATPGAFNAFETSTAAGATTGVIQTKVAGVAFSLDVVAILSGAQHATFTTTVLLDLLGNNTLGVALDAQNCPTSFTLLQSVTPNPTISGGRSTVSFAAVANSWRDVRVRVRFPVTSPSVTSCSTDNFAIRPASFAVVASDNTWQSAGAARALTNVAASGGVVHAAGRNFRLAVTPSPGTATNYAGDPTVSALTCTLPATCANGTLNVGTFAGAGTRTSDSATYSQAGAFNLTLVDQTFAQVDSGDGTSADCSGLHICQSPAPLAVGRFVPDHFAIVAGTAPQFRTFDALDAACSGARTFTYVGQQFGHATAPTATVEARNAGGGVTSNYRGVLWKIVAADVVQTYSNPGKTINHALGAPTLTEVANSGTGTLSANAADKISFARGAEEAPFTAAISLTRSVSDGTELAGDADNGAITTTTPLVVAATFDGAAGGAEIRFGRLRLANANGSQLTPLPMLMEAQYWGYTNPPTNTVLGFITNVDDHCTAIASTDVAMTFTGNLAPAPTNCKTVLSGGGTLSAGRRTLMLSAPGSANDGAAMLTVNLGAASGNTCTVNTTSPPAGASGAGRTYLRGNWTGATFTEDPTARATFGAFKGAGEVIFIRENF